MSPKHVADAEICEVPATQPVPGSSSDQPSITTGNNEDHLAASSETEAQPAVDLVDSASSDNDSSVV